MADHGHGGGGDHKPAPKKKAKSHEGGPGLPAWLLGLGGFVLTFFIARWCLDRIDHHHISATPGGTHFVAVLLTSEWSEKIEFDNLPKGWEIEVPAATEDGQAVRCFVELLKRGTWEPYWNDELPRNYDHDGDGIGDLHRFSRVRLSEAHSSPQWAVVKVLSPEQAMAKRQ